MADFEFDNVGYDFADGIATITVNRPKKLNALNADVLDELGQAFEDAVISEEVGVIVLTGAGDKAFVAGADIGMLAEQGVVDGRENSQLGQDLMELIEDAPKPVIGAINGFALGGGLELALACDFRYASSNAKFALPEVGLGIIPGYGGTQRLPRLVGVGRAMEMIMSGDTIDAAEALRIGLVNRVVDPEQLLDSVYEVARRINSKGPVAVRMAKEAVRRGMLLPLKEGLGVEADLFGVISATGDMKEGMQAFLEKRKPNFQGK